MEVAVYDVRLDLRVLGLPRLTVATNQRADPAKGFFLKGEKRKGLKGLKGEVASFRRSLFNLCIIDKRYRVGSSNSLGLVGFGANAHAALNALRIFVSSMSSIPLPPFAYNKRLRGSCARHRRRYDRRTLNAVMLFSMVTCCRIISSSDS